MFCPHIGAIRLKPKNQFWLSVESVEKVYVDKTESFIDVDDIQWNSVDKFLKSKNNAKIWKDLKFRRQIFSKCYLWDTFEDYYGGKSREILRELKKKKEPL